MAVNFGASEITTLKLGNSQVDRAYLGTTLVWESLTAVLAGASYSAYGGDSASPYNIGAHQVLEFRTDGTLYEGTAANNGTGWQPMDYVKITGWLSTTPQPSTTADDYEMYVTLTSGTLYSGTVNSWVNLGTLQAYQVYVTRTTAGTTTQSATISVQIRKVGTTTNLATASYTITATAEGVV